MGIPRVPAFPDYIPMLSLPMSDLGLRGLRWRCRKQSSWFLDSSLSMTGVQFSFQSCVREARHHPGVSHCVALWPLRASRQCAQTNCFTCL